MLIGDERVAETFTAPGDEAERLFYGYSVVACLANGLVDPPSVGTGTVLRPAALEAIAREAGFTRLHGPADRTRRRSASTGSIRSSRTRCESRAKRLSRRRKPSLTRPRAVLSSAAGRARLEGARRDRPRRPRVHSPEVSLAPDGAVVGGGIVAGPSQPAGRRRARRRAPAVARASSPSCKRSLGFLSNFAVAFSYISVATGIVHAHRARPRLGGPAFFWSWPIVILGQTFVALNFAELASHFPVAGSIYQWSKRLSQPDARLVHRLVLLLGRRRHRHRGRRHRPARPRRASSAIGLPGDPSPARRPSTTSSFIALIDARHHDAHQRVRRAGCCRSSTTSASATEILGMLVFALDPVCSSPTSRTSRS